MKDLEKSVLAICILSLLVGCATNHSVSSESMRTSNSVVTETDSSNSFLQSGMSEEEFEQSEQSEQSELDTESGKVASETLAAAVSDRNRL